MPFPLPKVEKDRKLPFVARGLRVCRGDLVVASCSSHTMARRVANALNRYIAGPRGY